MYAVKQYYDRVGIVTDEAKLRFFPSYLEGSALDWHRFAWEAQVAQGWIQLSSGPVIPTWCELVRAREVV